MPPFLTHEGNLPNNSCIASPRYFRLELEHNGQAYLHVVVSGQYKSMQFALSPFIPCVPEQLTLPTT